MERTASVSFESADAADRAIAKLRRVLPGLRAEFPGRQRGAMPGEAPFTALANYPWRMNMQLNESATLAPELGSRVLYTSDLMGLPLYHDGETRVLLHMDNSELERARALSVNLGGRSFQLQ